LLLQFTMSEAKFYYFDIRGRGESCRLALHLANVKFEEQRISFNDQWPTIKPTIPFGQLPYYEEGNVKIPQSQAILRHVARTNGLYGSSVEDATEIDVITEAALDILDLSIAAAFGSANKTMDETLAEYRSKIAFHLDNLEKRLSNKTWFVTDSATIADCAVYDALENYVKNLAPVQFKAHPSLQQFCFRFSTIPRISNYLSSGRRPLTCLIFGRAKLLATTNECL